MIPNDIPQAPIGDDIDLLCQAVDLAASLKVIGPATIQRKIRVGFARAARLTDLLEANGLVRRQPGTLACDVLITERDAGDVKADLREIAAAEAEQ